MAKHRGKNGPVFVTQEAIRKSSLSREAIMALGNISPELAWLQTRTSFAGAIQDCSQASEELARMASLRESVESLQAGMEKTTDPDLSLQGHPESARR